jgi:DNA-binding MltR family transcriptional regulator
MTQTWKELLNPVLSVVMSGLTTYTAVVAGEDLNQRLELLLKCFLLDEHRREHKLFGDSQPLGNFYARIEMAAALGLISRDERDDLNLIRQIRNHVAHHPLGELSFDDAKIKTKCARLKTPVQFNDQLFAPLFVGNVIATLGGQEGQFSKAFLVLATALIARTHNAVRRQTPEPLQESEIRNAIGELASEQNFGEPESTNRKPKPPDTHREHNL